MNDELERLRKACDEAAILSSRQALKLPLDWDALIIALDEAGYTEDRCDDLMAAWYDTFDRLEVEA